MPWVPIEESSTPFSYSDFWNTMMADSIVSKSASTGGSEWEISDNSGEGFMFRVTALQYANGSPGASFTWYDGGNSRQQHNEDPSGDTFSPTSFTGTIDPGDHLYYYSDPQEVRQEQYMFLIEVWEEPELVANDDEATTPMNTPVTVPVLANDTYGDEPVALEDLAGPPTIVTQPPVGTATVNPDGTITYTPPEGFTGEVEFQYMIEKPEPEPCAWVLVYWYDQSIQPSDMGDLPSWFIEGEDFDLSWEGNQNSWQWDQDSDLYSPADGETPGACRGTIDGTLVQGDNEVCVKINTECPA